MNKSFLEIFTNNMCKHKIQHDTNRNKFIKLKQTDHTSIMMFSTVYEKWKQYHNIFYVMHSMQYFVEIIRSVKITVSLARKYLEL